MKASRWIVYVVGSLLVLFALDCLLIHPAGRWQIVSSTGIGIVKMDTTSGNVWHFVDGKWELLPAEK